MSIDRYVGTGAWVAEPDMDPELWRSKAVRDAELRKVVPKERFDEFHSAGGVLALAKAANAALSSGGNVLPATVVLAIDD